MVIRYNYQLWNMLSMQYNTVYILCNTIIITNFIAYWFYKLLRIDPDEGISFTNVQHAYFIYYWLFCSLPVLASNPKAIITCQNCSALFNQAKRNNFEVIGQTLPQLEHQRSSVRRSKTWPCGERTGSVINFPSMAHLNSAGASAIAARDRTRNGGTPPATWLTPQRTSGASGDVAAASSERRPNCVARAASCTASGASAQLAKSRGAPEMGSLGPWAAIQSYKAARL